MVDIIKSYIFYPRTMVEHVSGGEYRITLHFPRFTISNSKGLKHIIRDLFVLLPITITSDKEHFVCSAYELYGKRTTYTVDELDKNYTHSHLSGTSLDGYTEFCLGGDEVPIYQAIKEGYTHPLDNLQYIVEMIETMVQWESLEGVPYEYIKTILNKSSDTSDAISLPSDSLLLRRILPELPVQITPINGKYLVAIDLQKLQEKKETLHSRVIRALWGEEKQGTWYHPSTTMEEASFSLGIQEEHAPTIFNGVTYPVRTLLDHTYTQGVKESNLTIALPIIAHIEGVLTEKFEEYLEKHFKIIKTSQKKELL